MNNNEKALLIAQSKLLAHMAERIVILQVSFEAFMRQRLESVGDNLDEHYAVRRQMLDQDFSGAATAHINTLKEAICHADTPEV